MRRGAVSFGVVLLWLAATGAIASAQTRGLTVSRQYAFAGQCNGLDHWVSLLYEPARNAVSTIIVKASCPQGEPTVTRIIRGRIIPVTVGGQFSDIVTYPGISYLVSGQLVSSHRATLAIKGPPKALACRLGEQAKATVCEQFTLSAK